jgi:predicted DCC family thiol-disulfide oxidoreductase YuxK
MLVFFMNVTNERIVLFDGVCNYCNAMVNFAIRNDKKAILKFAPLQSDTGRRLKEKYKITPEIDSVIFIENEKVYTYSDAAIRITKYLSWPAKILYGFIIVPKIIRQPFYKWVAKNRYKWFGKKEACVVPGPDVRARFLE